MKKLTKLVIISTLLLCGCTNKKQQESISSMTKEETKIAKHSGDAFDSYTESVNNAGIASSYSVGINSAYTMSYSDDTKDIFEFDGVLETEKTGDDTKAHLTQNIESNGGTFNIEGYYYGGRLYNNYNDVKYYEDMDYADVEKTMLVPLNPYAFDEKIIDSIQAEDVSNGNVIYTIQLKADQASTLFSDRYDTYGLNQYDDYQVTSNKIVDTFDKDGFFISETTEFNTSVSSNGQKVNVKYTSSVNYLKLNDTEVSISKDQKKDLKEYVYFEDIDTSSLNSDSQYDDTAEKTVTDTFKKRLVNRLGYEKANDGSYQQSYNDNEAYIIDFKNYTFTYTKYSIRYTYNWKGDIATMGSCTVNYQEDKQSSSCEESTVDMMKTVKQYFEMELYYCGLSLDDLQEEAK